MIGGFGGRQCCCLLAAAVLESLRRSCLFHFSRIRRTSEALRSLMVRARGEELAGSGSDGCCAARAGERLWRSG